MLRSRRAEMARRTREITSVRRDVEQLGDGPQRRYSPDLRRKIEELARNLRHDGASFAVISEETPTVARSAARPQKHEHRRGHPLHAHLLVPTDPLPRRRADPPRQQPHRTRDPRSGCRAEEPLRLKVSSGNRGRVDPVLARRNRQVQRRRSREVPGGRCACGKARRSALAVGDQLTLVAHETASAAVKTGRGELLRRNGSLTRRALPFCKLHARSPAGSENWPSESRPCEVHGPDCGRPGGRPRRLGGEGPGRLLF